MNDIISDCILYHIPQNECNHNLKFNICIALTNDNYVEWSLSCKWISLSSLKSGSQSDWDVVKCNCKCSRGLRTDDDESVLGGNVIKIMVLKPYLWLACSRVNLVFCVLVYWNIKVPACGNLGDNL